MFHTTLAVFTWVDWAVLGGYLLGLAGIGLWMSRRKQADTDDYFLAGRRIPMWAAALSLMSTALSGATFVGTPELAYNGNLTYLWSYAGQVIAAVVVALLFVPEFYRQRVTTVYELLETRYGIGSRRAASAMFMVGRVFASGVRLYIAALAVAMVMIGNIEMPSICMAIAVMMLVGVVFTLAGGIEAVVWVEVVQCVVFVGAAVIAIVYLLGRIPVGLSEVVSALQTGGNQGESKLTVWKSGFDTIGAAGAFSFLTAITGHTLVGIGAFGTDQDLSQRMLTCKTPRAASWAAVSGVVVAVPVALMFLAVGLLLWVFYKRPDLMGVNGPTVFPATSKEVFQTFIFNEMSGGLGGIMIAGLFAAALMNSELNSMSSTLVCDFYKPMRSGRPDHHYVTAGRWGVVFWGVVLGGFAMLSAYWQQKEQQQLINFALGVMTYAYSGLVGVFLTVLLTKRGNSVSVMLAFATGFCTVYLLNFQPWAAMGYKKLDIGFPWVMTIATVLSFVVCCTGGRGRWVPERT